MNFYLSVMYTGLSIWDFLLGNEGVLINAAIELFCGSVLWSILQPCIKTCLT